MQKLSQIQNYFFFLNPAFNTPSLCEFDWQALNATFFQGKNYLFLSSSEK